MPLDNWGTPLRDVLTDSTVDFQLGELNSKFVAFYENDGGRYERPYENINARLREPLTENRIETWKKLFDNLGLIYVEDGVIHVTGLGRRVADAANTALSATLAAKSNVAAAAIGVLGRYQLLNPTTQNRDYPPDCDVFPFRCIWKCMLDLGDLHWEELHRVILRIMHQSELPTAMQKIRDARAANYDPNDAASAQQFLGPPIYSDTDQVTRRMTPWFSAAGFGGLLIDREATNGRRSLTPEYRGLIASALETPPPWRDFDQDQTAWFRHLDQGMDDAGAGYGEGASQEYSDVIDGALRFGSRQIILLSGVAGTGKTRCARAVGLQLSGGDPRNYFEVQFHQAFTYEEFVEGLFAESAGQFVVRKGILRTANDRAKELEGSDPSARCVLVIEELSRANVASVLGELLTYIEHRGRTFYLPMSQGYDAISDRLVILATANLLDRSVVNLDDALIRRFREFEFTFSVTALRRILAPSLDESVISRLISGIAPICAELPFGHGVFSDVKSEADLGLLWQQQLRRYFLKPTGQRHPLTDRFIAAYPWSTPNRDESSA